MKSLLKVLTALAAIAGAVYVIATYGDKIVAWAKKLLASCPCHCDKVTAAVDVDFAEEAPVEEAPEAPADETPAEEAAPVEAVPVEEAPVAENEPVADETDFAD